MKNYIVILNDYQKFLAMFEQLKNENNMNEFDVKIYDLENTDLNKILSEINYQPIFSEKALFVIKNVELLTKEDCENFYKVLKNVPENLFFILYGMSIKSPFKETVIKEEILPPEKLFFKKVNSLKKKDSQKIFEILKEYMYVREKNFAVLITGIDIYLRNLIKKENKISKEIIKKYEKLLELDFFLKTGQLELGSELEINLLYYFFSDCN